MKKWGLLVSVYYSFVVLALFWPFLWAVYLCRGETSLTWDNYVDVLRRTSSEWRFAVPMVLLILGQFLLLFITVDLSNRRLKPRARLIVPTILTGFFTAVLGFGVVTSLAVAIRGDKFFDYLDGHSLLLTCYLGVWPLLWIVWAVVFYFYARRDENPVARATAWLLKGSILEFLIVVPCHVIVRRREECCAPYATSLGLCTGLALMLLTFGPSVLLLYKQRAESYSSRTR